MLSINVYSSSSWPVTPGWVKQLIKYISTLRRYTTCSTESYFIFVRIKQILYSISYESNLNFFDWFIKIIFNTRTIASSVPNTNPYEIQLSPLGWFCYTSTGQLEFNWQASQEACRWLGYSGGEAAELHRRQVASLSIFYIMYLSRRVC